ncbi:M3 family oligoendopeptidase [Cohnella sp. JJ-181]|uniref:M3 family oligoendopeptidase n=1 Tax=Cohnella rhizoplanae TaxID=2974897 RepID=UPI0022FF6B10|nr:M3 family oligoendopeptidase [Cohnella sp. JJ-181]CAI6038906.1 Oligoendopeptidase F, plasmid [Cohnella sp. JJ-181]
MTDSYSQVWDLDKIFSGGSESPEFAAFAAALERDTGAVLAELQSAGDGVPDEARLTDWTSGLQDLTARLREAFSYVGCLSAQDMDDRKATAWTEKLQSLSAKLGQSLDLYDAALARVPEADLEAWIATEPVSEIAFVIRERRDFVKEKLPPALESLAGELAVDGYHGWGENYQTIVSRIAIPWEEDGQVKKLSAGQAFNKLLHPNQRVRDEMGAKWEEAWAGQASLAADSLNRIAGFRLKLYQARGWQDPLKEPLLINRMSRDTLDAMWEGVASGMEPFKRYMAAKARLLGKERLDWHDVSAPVGAEGGAIAYDAAAALIKDAFGGFSQEQARLAERAFAGRWIEAEDRAGKRPGGFCTDFPLTGETRIFMTYSGTADNVSTLAHELGHAYHDVCVDGLQPFGRNYAMNVAETASTFAEGLVSDALLRAADSDEARLSLLDERLQRASAFCHNIHARFLFETRFYEARKSGMLDVEALNELMVAAQKEAFGDALSSWHPHFWAAKLHFYATDVPFYNFPYTFGFLFSTGIAAVAEAEGPGFHARYDRLLRDTGLMTVEELGRRHLGVALDKPEFWQAAVKRATDDVAAFEALCAR